MMGTQGRIDGIRRRYMIGWAHDPQRPGARLELEIDLDGISLGTCLADLRRGDLLAAGVGDGNHGFRFQLPSALEPGSEHEIRVRSLADGVLLPLANNYLSDANGDANAQPLVLRTAPDPAEQAASAEQRPDGAPAPAPPAAVETLEEQQPSVPQALVGTAGWLFGYEGQEGLERRLGIRSVSPTRVQQQVQLLRQRHERLAAAGIAYLPVTLPDKAAVYDDQLAIRMGLEPEGRSTAKLVSELRREPHLELLDLLWVLRDGKRRGLVFPRRGLGLTWLGAFEAYWAVMKELSKRVRGVSAPGSITLELGKEVPLENPLVSRERIIRVGEESIPVVISDSEAETEPDLIRTSFTAMYSPVPEELAEQLGPEAAVLDSPNSTGSGELLIVHDGSGTRIIPFVAEHFTRTVVDVATELPYDVIEQRGPVAVLEIFSDTGPFLT